MSLQSFLQKLNRINIITIILYIFAALTAGMGVVIMTDFGQIFGINKSWVVWYFKNSLIIMLLSLTFFAPAVYLTKRDKQLKNLWLAKTAN